MAADDSLLRHYAAAIVDIKTMQLNVTNLWHQVISIVMPDISDDDDMLMEGS